MSSSFTQHRLEQRENAPTPSARTFSGISTASSAQEANAKSPIVLRPWPNTASRRLPHEQNASAHTSRTVGASRTSSSALSAKQPRSSFSIPAGMLTRRRFAPQSIPRLRTLEFFGILAPLLKSSSPEDSDASPADWTTVTFPQRFLSACASGQPASTYTLPKVPQKSSSGPRISSRLAGT